MLGDLTATTLIYWAAVCTVGGFIVLLIGLMIAACHRSVENSVVLKGGIDTDFLGSMIALVSGCFAALSFVILVIGIIWYIILSIIDAFMK